MKRRNYLKTMTLGVALSAIPIPKSLKSDTYKYQNEIVVKRGNMDYDFTASNPDIYEFEMYNMRYTLYGVSLFIFKNTKLEYFKLRQINIYHYRFVFDGLDKKLAHELISEMGYSILPIYMLGDCDVNGKIIKPSYVFR